MTTPRRNQVDLQRHTARSDGVLPPVARRAQMRAWGSTPEIDTSLPGGIDALGRPHVARAFVAADPAASADDASEVGERLLAALAGA